MAPAATSSDVQVPAGPPPSHINVAKPYLFEQQLQGAFVATGANPSREDMNRIHGVQWINDVRNAMQLPVRTYDTAVNYYHKFRLSHKDTEYQYQDAAAGALFCACKVEDTLKKSREILCAAHNLKVSASEYLSADDSSFDGPSKIAIGIERLMLESSGFDFRSRYPQKHLFKLSRAAGIEKDVLKTAYEIMLDMYKTFAASKQTCSTMSFACLELATLVLGKQQEAINGPHAPTYKKWCTTRGEIVETILDLLDLYTHFQKSTFIGPRQSIEQFIQIRIKVNQEVEQNAKISRHTEFHEAARTNGFRSNVKTPKTPITPASPSDVRTNGASPATLSPRSSGSSRRGMGGRGQDGTVRFMLDAEQAKREKAVVNEYFKTEYEEYEVEVEEAIKPEREERGPRYHPNHRNNREERGFLHKRLRR